MSNVEQGDDRILGDSEFVHKIMEPPVPLLIPMNNKKTLIFLLVFLFTILAPSMIWVIRLDQAREISPPARTWGTPEEIMATAVLVLIIGAIIGVAILLQRAMGAYSAGSTKLPKIKAGLTIPVEQAEAFFEKPPPRQLNESLFAALKDAVFPPVAKIMFIILIPLTIIMMVMLILLTLSLNKSDRMLQTDETVTTQGVVTHVEKKSSRSGVKYAVTYHFTPDGTTEETKGISYNKSADVTPEQQVLVEYLSKAPAVSRIKGMQSSPVDFMMPVIMAGMLFFAILPGILFYIVSRRRFLKDLITEGRIVWGGILKIRQGGRGMIFAKVLYEFEGIPCTKKLLCPAIQGLYHPLAARKEKELPVLLLVHPDRSNRAYLFEPHLTEKRGCS